MLFTHLSTAVPLPTLYTPKTANCAAVSPGPPPVPAPPGLPQAALRAPHAPPRDTAPRPGPFFLRTPKASSTRPARAPCRARLAPGGRRKPAGRLGGSRPARYATPLARRDSHSAAGALRASEALGRAGARRPELRAPGPTHRERAECASRRASGPEGQDSALARVATPDLTRRSQLGAHSSHRRRRRCCFATLAAILTQPLSLPQHRRRRRLRRLRRRLLLLPGEWEAESLRWLRAALPRPSFLVPSRCPSAWRRRFPRTEAGPDPTRCAAHRADRSRAWERDVAGPVTPPRRSGTAAVSSGLGSREGSRMPASWEP